MERKDKNNPELRHFKKENSKNARAIIESIRQASDQQLLAMSLIGEKLDEIREALKGVNEPLLNTKKGKKGVYEGEYTEIDSPQKTPKEHQYTPKNTQEGKIGVTGEIIPYSLELAESAKSIAPPAENEGEKERPVFVDVHVPESKKTTAEQNIFNDNSTKNNTSTIQSSQSQRPNEIALSFENPRKKRRWVEEKQSEVATESVTNETALAQELIRDAKESSESAREIREFERYYRDENGRLRRPDGKYASNKEQERYSKAEEVAKRNQEERQAGVIAKLVSGISTVAKTLTQKSEDDSEVTEIAGAAAGGSFFYAAKEMYDLGGEVARKVHGLTGKKGEREKPGSIEQRESSRANERTEVIKEQTAAQAENTQKIIKAIEDMETKAGNRGESGGLLSSIAEGMDIDLKRKDKASRWGKMKSVLSDGVEPVTRNRSFSNAFKAGGKVLGKVAAPLAGVMASYDRFSDIKDDETLSVSQKAAQVGSTGVGAAGGALAGAAAGAAVGSFIPVVGTAIGGLIGGVLGGMGGAEIGEKVGVAISDFMATDKTLPQYVNETATTIWDKASSNAISAFNSVKSFFGFGTSEPASENAESATSSPLSWLFGEDESPKAVVTTVDAVTTAKTKTEPLKASANQVAFKTSESASEVINRTRINATEPAQMPTTVSLDKRSLDALMKVANKEQPKPQNMATSNPNVTVKTAVIPATTSQIPSDFSDMSLRRLAMDQE